jgi:hypothetical protein
LSHSRCIKCRICHCRPIGLCLKGFSLHIRTGGCLLAVARYPDRARLSPSRPPRAFALRCFALLSFASLSCVLLSVALICFGLHVCFRYVVWVCFCLRCVWACVSLRYRCFVADVALRFAPLCFALLCFALFVCVVLRVAGPSFVSLRVALLCCALLRFVSLRCAFYF